MSISGQPPHKQRFSVQQVEQGFRYFCGYLANKNSQKHTCPLTNCSKNKPIWCAWLSNDAWQMSKASAPKWAFSMSIFVIYFHLSFAVFFSQMRVVVKTILAVIFAFKRLFFQGVFQVEPWFRSQKVMVEMTQSQQFQTLFVLGGVAHNTRL